jgi:hypothetical protein
MGVGINWTHTKGFLIIKKDVPIFLNFAFTSLFLFVLQRGFKHVKWKKKIKGTYNGNWNYEEVIQPLSNYKEEFNTKPTRWVCNQKTS